MSTLYWIITLGNLSIVMCLLTVMLVVTLLFTCIVATVGERWDDLKYLIKGMAYAAVPMILLSVFIPSKKDLFIIYGVGTTLDYIKDNPQAKQLPDKCIKVIGNYFDDILNEDTDK